MKTIGTTVCTMLAIAGLCMAGADAESFTTQLIVCTAGLMLFIIGMCGVGMIHGGKPWDPTK